MYIVFFKRLFREKRFSSSYGMYFLKSAVPFRRKIINVRSDCAFRCCFQTGRRCSHAFNVLCSKSETVNAVAETRIETSSPLAVYAWPVLLSIPNITVHYSTISVCPPPCRFSALCTFYSIRLDPLTKTCFCGLVLKAIQSSKYKVCRIQHVHRMKRV